MLNQKVLEYVDDVMSRIAKPKEFKTKLENELIRHIIEASENTSVDEVIDKLGSPERLAIEMSRKSVNDMSKKIDNNLMEVDKQNVKPMKIHGRSCKKLAPVQKHDRNISPRYIGEYMREESNVNIKLLYIPLIQISSGIERIRLPLVDECYID